MTTAIRRTRSVRTLVVAGLAAFVLVLAVPGIAAAGDETPVETDDPYATTTTTVQSTTTTDPGTTTTTEVAGTTVTSPDTTDPGVDVEGTQTDTGGGTLPFTGGDIAVLASIGAALVALGVVLVVVRRRRAAHV